MGSHLWRDQDEMVNERHSIKISRYYLDMCETLKTVLQGRNANDLDESARMAPEDLEGCVYQL